MLLYQFHILLYHSFQIFFLYHPIKNKIKKMKTQRQTPSTEQNTQSRNSQNPETKGIRKAAAKLKDKQAQVQMLKKRFQVLKGHEQYNRYRTMDQQKRIKQHHSIHQNIREDRLSYEKQLNQKRQSLALQLQQRHDQINSQLKSTTKQAYENLYSSRINERNKLKQMSEMNEKLIDMNKKLSLEQNHKRKQYVISEENKQKQAIDNFKTTHVNTTLTNRSIDAGKMSRKAEQKDKQLQKLMEYQQEMLRKASQSIAMNQRLKSQFGKVFVDVKQKNTVKLPSISRNSGTNRSNLSQYSKTLSIYQV